MKNYCLKYWLSFLHMVELFSPISSQVVFSYLKIFMVGSTRKSVLSRKASVFKRGTFSRILAKTVAKSVRFWRGRLGSVFGSHSRIADYMQGRDWQNRFLKSDPVIGYLQEIWFRFRDTIRLQ